MSQRLRTKDQGQRQVELRRDMTRERPVWSGTIPLSSGGYTSGHMLKTSAQVLGTWPRGQGLHTFRPNRGVKYVEEGRHRHLVYRLKGSLARDPRFSS